MHVPRCQKCIFVVATTRIPSDGAACRALGEGISESKDVLAETARRSRQIVLEYDVEAVSQGRRVAACKELDQEVKDRLQRKKVKQYALSARDMI